MVKKKNGRCVAGPSLEGPAENPPTLPSDQRSDTNGTADEAAANGNGDKRHPVYKVGPVPCDKNTSVECAVWENEITLGSGGSFKVHESLLPPGRGAPACHLKGGGFRGCGGFFVSKLFLKTAGIACLYCMRYAMCQRKS